MKVSATNKSLISYDVWTLYTSIPFKGTIDILFNLILEQNSGLKITIAELKRLTAFATSGTYLFFRV